MVRYEIKLGGFGGQGIALMGRILGIAASIHQKPRKTSVFTQSYGPESRGGASSANVVIETEGKEIEFPYVQNKNVDFLVLMSKEAYTTYLPQFLKDGGIVVIDPDMVEIDDNLKRASKVYRFPATAVVEKQLNRRMVANIAMLGFIADKFPNIISPEALLASTLENVPPKFKDLNKKAFELGLKYKAES